MVAGHLAKRLQDSGEGRVAWRPSETIDLCAASKQRSVEASEDVTALRGLGGDTEVVELEVQWEIPLVACV